MLFLVSQVLSFRLKKQTNKNIADTTFNVKRDFFKAIPKIKSNKIKISVCFSELACLYKILYVLCFTDYDAPVGETGQVKAKYGVFKKTIKEYAPEGAGRLKVK